MNEPYSCISRMEGLEIRNPEITLIRSKSGISLYRVTAQGRRLVLKVFEKQENTREIENYRILSLLGIPTLPLLGHTRRIPCKYGKRLPFWFLNYHRALHPCQRG